MVTYSQILHAIALLCMFEGILPFMSPKIWRGVMVSLIKQNDKSIRIMGFVCMLMGLAIIYFS